MRILASDYERIYAQVRDAMGESRREVTRRYSLDVHGMLVVIDARDIPELQAKIAETVAPGLSARIVGAEPIYEVAS